MRSMSPQQGQRPSSLMGPVASARSQCPRASQSGLMHWTVKPGKYCMRFLQWTAARVDSRRPTLATQRERERLQASRSPRANGQLPPTGEKQKLWRGLLRRMPVVSRGNTTRCGGAFANVENSVGTVLPLPGPPRRDSELPKVVPTRENLERFVGRGFTRDKTLRKQLGFSPGSCQRSHPIVARNCFLQRRVHGNVGGSLR